MQALTPFSVRSLDVQPLTSGLADNIIGRTLKYVLDQASLDNPDAYTVALVFNQGDCPYELLDERRHPTPRAIHLMWPPDENMLHQVIVLEIDSTLPSVEAGGT